MKDTRNPCSGSQHHLPLAGELAAFGDFGEDAAMQAADLADIETIRVEPVLREDLEAGRSRGHSEQINLLSFKFRL